MNFILNGFRNSFLVVKQRTLLERTSNYVRVTKRNPFCSTKTEFSMFTNVLRFGRKYCTNQSIPNSGSKQWKDGKGPNVLKYLSGIIGACLLTAAGVREYWKRQYRKKGLEPVKNVSRFGWRHTSFYYGDYKVPDIVVDNIEEIPTFKVRENDVWILGFPKSGTTWLQEIVYLVVNDANLDSAKSNVEDRIPFFEYNYPGIKAINTKPSPRFIKTHLPFSILPSDYYNKKPKTVYIARNPKDVLVSLYFFLYQFFVQHKFDFTFEEFCQIFVEGDVAYGPWWKHVKEGWERRNDENVLYITYEDMKTDFIGSIKKIAVFFGKELSDKDIASIASHCSFNQMRNNSHVNLQSYKDRGIANKDAHFMRRGKVGDWRNHLSQDVTSKLDNIVKTNLEPLGISFNDTSRDSN